MLEFEEGLDECTESELNDLLGYLGTWVNLIFYPADKKSGHGDYQEAMVGRFLGFHVGDNDATPSTLVFEGYTVVVDGGKPLRIGGINEDKVEDI